jgi:hypothetical protein
MIGVVVGYSGAPTPTPQTGDPPVEAPLKKLEGGIDSRVGDFPAAQSPEVSPGSERIRTTAATLRAADGMSLRAPQQSRDVGSQLRADSVSMKQS